MGRLTIQELTSLLQEKNGIDRKEAQTFITTLFELIQEGVNTDKLVKVKGLGTFKVVDVGARESVSVNTGGRVLIDGHSKISFTPDSLMKELVNKPFSGFETVILNEGVNFDDMPDGGEELSAEDDTEEETEIAPNEPIVVEEERIEAEEERIEVEEERIEAEEERIEVEEERIEVEEERIEVEEDPVVVEEEPTENVLEVEPLLEIVDEEDELVTSEPQEPQVTPEEAEELEEVEEPEEAEELEEVEEPEEEAKGRGWTWILWLLLCAACFAAGYFLGRYKAPVPEKEATEVKDEPVTITVGDSIEQHADSAAVVTDTLSQQDADTIEVAVEPVVSQQENTDEEYKKYEEMDVRVRTGAYRIIGTAEEVKAREGETVERISRRFFGPDMSCYVEVYNGLDAKTPLKAGQVVKIPKLKFKKKKK